MTVKIIISATQRATWNLKNQNSKMESRLSFPRSIVQFSSSSFKAARVFCGNSGGFCGKHIMLTRARLGKYYQTRLCKTPRLPCPSPGGFRDEAAAPAGLPPWRYHPASRLRAHGDKGKENRTSEGRISTACPAPVPRCVTPSDAPRALKRLPASVIVFPAIVVRIQLAECDRSGLASSRGEHQNGATESLQELH